MQPNETLYLISLILFDAYNASQNISLLPVAFKF